MRCRSGPDIEPDAIPEPMNGNSNPADATLLDADEPPAFELVNASGAGSAVLVCDHASNTVPRRLGTLGLDAMQLADHIGWDPGAAALARRLSAELDAPLVLSGYSRLVIDCNRPLGHVESMAEHSAGVTVQGNRTLSPTARQARIHALFLPYHHAIDQLLDDRAPRRGPLLSIHSFAPVLNQRARPWNIGVCHGHDRRLAALMLGALSRAGDVTVGDNQPYDIDDAIDYTIPVHGEARGLPSVMFELRQDGLRTIMDSASWAARLAGAYRSIEAEALRLCEPDLGA